MCESAGGSTTDNDRRMLMSTKDTDYDPARSPLVVADATARGEP